MNNTIGTVISGRSTLHTCPKCGDDDVDVSTKHVAAYKMTVNLKPKAGDDKNHVECNECNHQATF